MEQRSSDAGVKLKPVPAYAAANPGLSTPVLNSLPETHMRCMITASLRTKATRARLAPRRRALRPHPRHGASTADGIASSAPRQPRRGGGGAYDSRLADMPGPADLPELVDPRRKSDMRTADHLGRRCFAGNLLPSSACARLMPNSAIHRSSEIRTGSGLSLGLCGTDRCGGSRAFAD
jgi:hypothetical protein